MLVHSLAWRKLHRIDKLLETYTPSEVLLQYYSGGWHYSDKGKQAQLLDKPKMFRCQYVSFLEYYIGHILVVLVQLLIYYTYLNKM